MRIQWLPVAKASFDAQLSYIAERDSRAAALIGDRILGAIDRLRAHPLSARAGRVDGTRELVVVGTPFIVAYRVELDALLVLRVLHGKQRWPTRFQE